MRVYKFYCKRNKDDYILLEKEDFEKEVYVELKSNTNNLILDLEKVESMIKALKKMKKQLKKEV